VLPKHGLLRTSILVALLLVSLYQLSGIWRAVKLVRNVIIGKQYFMVLNDLDQLTGKFNGVNENKILTVCDEIGNFGGAYRSNDKLKNIITQDDQIIERKGFDAASVADYNNFVGFSNNEWPWKIESGDRRHLVLEVSNEKVGDKDYFDRLALLSTDECGEQFYNMLLRRDITHWNPLNIPMTQFKRECTDFVHERLSRRRACRFCLAGPNQAQCQSSQVTCSKDF
jgi:hypothetical protein